MNASFISGTALGATLATGVLLGGGATYLALGTSDVGGRSVEATVKVSSSDPDAQPAHLPPDQLVGPEVEDVEKATLTEVSEPEGDAAPKVYEIVLKGTPVRDDEPDGEKGAPLGERLADLERRYQALLEQQNVLLAHQLQAELGDSSSAEHAMAPAAHRTSARPMPREVEGDEEWEDVEEVRVPSAPSVEQENYFALVQSAPVYFIQGSGDWETEEGQDEEEEPTSAQKKPPTTYNELGLQRALVPENPWTVHYGSSSISVWGATAPYSQRHNPWAVMVVP